jgi:hypothetical protein
MIAIWDKELIKKFTVNWQINVITQLLKEKNNINREWWQGP